MKSTSTDPRAQRTRQMLREALMEIVVDKPFRNLTISDITRTAGINRATFYLHYEDKYDLLEDCANELFLEIRTTIEQELDLTPPKMFIHTAQEHCLRMQIVLKHIQKNNKFYQAMLSDDGDPLFSNLFRNTATQWIKMQVKTVFEYQNMLVDDDLIDMMVRFQSAGNFDVMSWWLENDMQIPIDVMAERLAKITMPTLIQMLTTETLET